MYSSEMLAAGIKGKRVPGRPGRFDPSEPLHMTTRGAKKKGTTNGSPSINGSLEDDESRRGSLDELRPLTSYSNGSQWSAKSRRVSETYSTLLTPDAPLNGNKSSEEKKSDGSISKSLPVIRQTPSPSRKRKRSSSATAPDDQSPLFVPPNDPIDTSFDHDNTIRDVQDDIDMVEVVPEEDLSDREMSPTSSQSQEADQLNETFISQSIDITPAISGPVSPATSESGSQDNAPLAKPLEEALEKAAQAVQDPTVDAIDDIDDADDVDEQPRSDDEERPRRRFGGRRRAAHPITKVEAAMRRQAELKSAYRAIARAQKLVLAEIAQRTIDDLETNQKLHEEANEYEDVRAGLDAMFQERHGRLDAQLKLNLGQMDQTLEAEQRSLRAHYAQKLEAAQDGFLDQAEYEMLRIARGAQLAGDDLNYENDHEGEVIPRPKAVSYRWERNGTLDAEYDSRSRVALETTKATEDMEQRFKMHKLLADLKDSENAETEPSRTFMNPERREAAKIRRTATQNTTMLAEAASEYERVSNIPVIPNAEALGLQLLGDLASRPSITGRTPEAVGARRRGNSFTATPPSRRLPPHLQLATNYSPSSVQVSVSPRTAQAIGGRFDASMPPPTTPRQVPAPFMRSPDVSRIEHPVPSPTMIANSSNGMQHLTPRPFDGRPGSSSDTFVPNFRDADGTQHRAQPWPESRFSTPQMSERRFDPPTWREYPSDQPVSRERALSNHSDRPPFSFPRGMALQDDRSNNIRPRPRDPPDSVKDEPSPFSRVHGRQPSWREPSSQPGASDIRNHNNRALFGEPRRPSVQTPTSMHSRNSSSGLPIHDMRTPANPTKDNPRQRPKSAKSSTFPTKTNKEERGGLPRRGFNKSRDRRSFGKSGSPPPLSASYAGSPEGRPPQHAPWNGPPPPQHSPVRTAAPPMAAYPPQQSPFGPPPPNNFPPNQHNFEFPPHRNSFPPPQPWNQPPPSPLYAVPQPQHPPPPGVAPEQYHHQFGHPPPRGYRAPQPPPNTPQSAHPPSGPGSYGQQFGGPPIAPATAHAPYRPGAFRPTQNLPAFAQQAQQHGNYSHRRRTQSDASHFPKFHSWNPPGERRG